MTEEQLKDLEKYAALLFNIKQISLLINFDFLKLKKEINNENSAAYKAYHIGILKTEVEIREKIIKFAKQGSPQAQAAVEKLLLNQKLEDGTR